jgi:hypothetical protein
MEIQAVSSTYKLLPVYQTPLHYIPEEECSRTRIAINTQHEFFLNNFQRMYQVTQSCQYSGGTVTFYAVVDVRIDDYRDE